MAIWFDSVSPISAGENGLDGGTRIAPLPSYNWSPNRWITTTLPYSGDRCWYALDTDDTASGGAGGQMHRAAGSVR